MPATKSGCAAFAAAERKSDGFHITTTMTRTMAVNGGVIARKPPYAARDSRGSSARPLIRIRYGFCCTVPKPVIDVTETKNSIRVDSSRDWHPSGRRGSRIARLPS